MSSPPKQKKCSKGLQKGQCEDRITNLPNCLITKILSSLSIKEAVATSVLSTKWKLSWTSITNLDFEDSKSSHWDTPAYKKFTNFVTRVLQLRDKMCLQRISIYCYRSNRYSRVNAWIIAILEGNVQELEITIPIKKPGQLPSDIFLCSRLVVLKLNLDGYLTLPVSVSLQNLKTLHICGPRLNDDVSITHLLSGCPLLENLSLSHCVGKDVLVVHIKSAVLKSLKIRYLSYDYLDDDMYEKYQIVIDTPMLEHLEIFDHIPKGYVLNNMDHLISAKIHFGLVTWPLNDDHEETITDFLNGISQVQTLRISYQAGMAMDSDHVVCPKFRNLTHLQTEGYLSPVFLENSPCLKTISTQQNDGVSGDKGISALRDVSSSVLFHLKNITIENFREDEFALEVVEHILINAKVLEELILVFPIGVECDEDCFKELLSFPKASPVCKVEVL